MENYLSHAWQQLASRYTSDQALITGLWKELEKAYAGKSRHYHNLLHIETMLRFAEEHQSALGSPHLVRFAIFYHDAVYRSTRSDNEEKSAQLAFARLQELGLSLAEADIVVEMILATKTHESHGNPDVDYLLDFDLAILGASWDAYLQYSQQIRKEYSLYPDFLYNKGRQKVLRHFLDKDSIFQTAPFKANLEGQARHNLEKELQLLST
ncbi:HD domain-containing protein [Rufibacter hautae]|uniref:Metal-dependent phosphohydrolase n=1 Tax=Rufibacter hautae TaxID=2595005 RepID=A0A5B6TD73_9BACT|nr:hypothetical protein [Rufibacter hautae]KAA3437053.1 hypothetical protein FOA19_22035 [Rufibacter hautae]